MSQKKIHIVWQNNRTVDICLKNNPVAEYYYSCIKHLQNIDLEFDARKNPLYAQQTSKELVVDELLTLATKINLSIQKDQLANQSYLNQLHTEYFSQAQKPQFDEIWLRIHDCIHLIEHFLGNGLDRSSIWFDYESKAGPLVKPFNRDYLQYAITDIKAGCCYIREHELGKSPALYQKHQESLNIDTVCSQSKPWVWLKPVLSIAYCDSNNYNKFDQVAFEKWFSPVRDEWCRHWNVPDWTPKEMFSVIPIGTVENLSELIDCFTNQDYPTRLTL